MHLRLPGKNQHGGTGIAGSDRPATTNNDRTGLRHDLAAGTNTFT